MLPLRCPESFLSFSPHPQQVREFKGEAVKKNLCRCNGKYSMVCGYPSRLMCYLPASMTRSWLAYGATRLTGPSTLWVTRKVHHHAAISLTHGQRTMDSTRLLAGVMSVVHMNQKAGVIEKSANESAPDDCFASRIALRGQLLVWRQECHLT